MTLKLTACAFAALALALPAAAEVAASRAERVAAERVAVSWTDTDPVDVYAAPTADTPLAKAKLVSAANRTGRFEAAAGAAERPYFLLRDQGDGKVVRVAERVLPLQQGSNFRDLGGYPAAGGKHVRWGLIYRSGATAMLTDEDVAQVRGLGLTKVIDLRSSEERVLAPTRLDGVRYEAVGYSMMRVMGPNPPSSMGDQRMHDTYSNFTTLLTPQLRILFEALLAGDGAVEFNCSAGQDRTGFASAMVLTALGVPRETIIADYHLSTTYRRPEYEMPKFDAATIAANPVAKMFAGFQSNPQMSRPQPLVDSAGTPLLAIALKGVEAKYGSVEGYLAKEVGVGPREIAKLRAMYLE